MSNRASWITDATNFGGIEEKDPTEIEDTTSGDVIECTGWWKAGVSTGNTTGMKVAVWASGGKGSGGDDLVYMTRWNDSSGNGNHLIPSQEGQGPQIFGDHVDYQGDEDDEVGNDDTTYPVAHFTDVTLNQAQGQLFLQCTPSVAKDFRISGTAGAVVAPLFTFIAVCRHHYTNGDLGNAQNSTNMGFLGMVASSINASSGYQSWAIGFGEGYQITGGGEVDIPTKAAFAAIEGGGAPTAVTTVYNTSEQDVDLGQSGWRDEDDVWGVLGVCQLGLSDISDLGMLTFSNPSYVVNGDTSHGNIDGNEEFGDDDGILTIGKATIYMNTDGSGYRQNFEGRIVEMACWKSDNAIPAYQRMQVLQYFKNKFSNDI